MFSEEWNTVETPKKVKSKGKPHKKNTSNTKNTNAVNDNKIKSISDNSISPSNNDISTPNSVKSINCDDNYEIIKSIIDDDVKPVENDNIYRLFDFLNEGGCLRCVTKTCTNSQPHGLEFPDEFAMFVKNPSKINGFSKAISDAKLDFNKKTPFYTICNYINGRCRNCEDGRIKHVTFQGEKITFCYPLLEKIRNKATIGIHIDIEVVKKGDKIESYILPLPPIQQKISHKKDYVNHKKNSISNNDNDNDYDNDHNHNRENDYSRYKEDDYSRDRDNYYLRERENDYSRDRDRNNDFSSDRENDYLNNELFPLLEVSSPSHSMSSFMSPSPSISSCMSPSMSSCMSPSMSPSGVKSPMNYINSFTGLDFSQATKGVIMEIAIEENQQKIDDSLMVSVNKTALSNIKIENEILRGELKKQQLIINSLNQDLNKAKFSNQNPEITSEVLYNLKRLNNRVSDDFMKTKYSVFSY